MAHRHCERQRTALAAADAIAARKKGRVARARRSARRRRTALSVMGVASEKRYCRRGENGAQAVPRKGLLAGFVKPAIEWRFWHCAIEHVDHFAILNIIMVGMLRIRNRALSSRSASVLTFTKRIFRYALPRRLQDRREATAGSAPWRPEIDNDRQIVLQEFIQRCPGRVDDVAVKRS